MSVPSIDRNTWQTKLDRIGTAAASKTDMVFNNLGHCITLEMLRDIYYQANGNKAIGIDNVTKEKYGKNLERNLRNLIERIRKGQYRPQPSRITEIPKEDGSFRPLAISCFEDKLIQNAVSIILNKIFEPIFLPCSFGSRPGRNCHEALRALNQYSWQLWDGAIIEIDICKYFNTIPHQVLNECLQKRISDKRFLRLINILLKAPILEGGKRMPNRIGCPQGSIISPILANIYLHYVIDVWFEMIKKTHMRADANEVRYLDDMVFVFRFRSEAEKFFKVLPKRLAKYGLEMHLDKSQMIPSGSKTALRVHRIGKRIPTYKFLGFLCYWSTAGNGQWRLKYKSRPDRFKAKLKGLQSYLRGNLNTNTNLVLDQVIRVVKGWINYHGISDNRRSIHAFIQQCRVILYKWFNRKGRKKPISWEIFSKILAKRGFPSSWKTISIYPNEPNKV